jgi:Flp pilus assembly protein TadD
MLRSPDQRPSLGICALAGFLSLLPVLNIFPQETRLSERFLYLPSAFWLVPAGMLLSLGWETRPAMRPLWATVLVGLVVFLGSIAAWRAHLWRMDLSVWSQAVREEPQRGAFWDRLGLTHMERRDFPRAESALQRAVQLDPDNFNAWHNLGVLMETRRSYPRAVAAFRRALELQPRSVSTHVHLGRIFAAMREHEAALAEFAAALDVMPNHVDTLRMAAMVAIQIEDFEAAQRYLERARQLEPDNRAIQQAFEKLERRRQAP